MQLTKDKLPEIRRTLDDALADVKAQLNELPSQLPDDKAFALSQLLEDLRKTILKVLDPAQVVGDAATERYPQLERRHFSTLREAVLAARPKLALVPAANSSSSLYRLNSSHATTSSQFGTDQAPGNQRLPPTDIKYWTASETEDDQDHVNGSRPAAITLQRVHELAEVTRKTCGAAADLFAYCHCCNVYDKIQCVNPRACFPQ